MRPIRLLEPEARFDMTPMMDIVFQLIAFFMIVSTFIVREKIELDLPVADQAATSDNQQHRWVVSLSGAEGLWLGAEPVSLEQLVAQIGSRAGEEPRPKIVIRADRSLPFGRVREVMKACRDGGLTDIIIASYQSGD